MYFKYAQVEKLMIIELSLHYTVTYREKHHQLHYRINLYNQHALKISEAKVHTYLCPGYQEMYFNQDLRLAVSMLLSIDVAGQSGCSTAAVRWVETI